MHFENIVIGNILCEPSELFACSEADWIENEKPITVFTNERFLPKILVKLGIYKSLNEIRRNRQDLWITLDKVDFIDKLKVAKKTFLWIAIGE